MSPEGRWYAALVAALGFLFLAGGSVLLITMLASVVGPFSIQAVRPPEEASAGVRVGLWTPASARGLDDFDPAAREAAFRRVLPDPYEVRASASLEELAAAGVAAVVVSEARALDAAELRQLQAFAAEGGAVLLSGWIGIRASDGSWRGTEAMRRLLGVREVATLPYTSAYFLAAGARGPLNAGLEPARRIALPRAFEAPALAAPDAPLLWADWRLRAVGEASGAARTWRHGRGAFAWIAAPPIDAPAAAGPGAGAAEAGDVASRALGRVYRNALAWTRALPVHEVLAWPGGASWAGMLALDTEQDFDNALHVAELARELELPMTYLVVSSLAEQHPRVLARLRESGQVGSHGDVHDAFADQPLARQRERLERSLGALRALGVADPRGFRPPYESEDAATVRALAELGVDHVFGDPEPLAAAPRVLAGLSVAGRGRPGSPEAALVRIPRTAADDVELMVGQGLREPGALWRALEPDLEFAEGRGGLFALSFHTHYFAHPAALPVVERLGRALKRRGAWLAPAGAIADWWRQREAVRTSLERRGPRRLVLQVTHLGSEPVRGVVVRIHLNRSVSGARASSATVLTRAPEVRHRAGEPVLDLHLPELPGRTNRSYTIDLES